MSYAVAAGYAEAWAAELGGLLAAAGLVPDPARLVVHAGGCLAEEAAAYADLGFGTVVWVEANPAAAARAAVAEPRVVCAALDAPGAGGQILGVASDLVSSSLLPLGSLTRYAPDLRYVSRLLVRTVTLDAVLDADADRVDGVVLDVQGVEDRVLAGATRTLDAARWVLAEVSEPGLYAGGCVLADVDAALPRFARAGLTAPLDPAGRVVRSGHAFYVRSPDR